MSPPPPPSEIPDDTVPGPERPTLEVIEPIWAIEKANLEKCGLSIFTSHSLGLMDVEDSSASPLVIHVPELSVYGWITGQPRGSFCMEARLVLLTTSVSVGCVAKLFGLPQLTPIPVCSNGVCMLTKRSNVPWIPLEVIEEGILLLTSATNHSAGAVPPVDVALEFDCKSISFRPPKDGVSEFASGIIISWPGVIIIGGVAMTWPEEELTVVTIVGIIDTTDVESGRV
jgi:hypothetical protein